MGALPSRQSDDTLLTLRYGSHEIALIPLRRMHFDSNTVCGGHLRRQFVRLRNDPNVRYHYNRDRHTLLDGQQNITTGSAHTEVPPASYTERDLDRLLGVVEDSLFETNEAFLQAAEQRDKFTDDTMQQQQQRHNSLHSHHHHHNQSNCHSGHASSRAALYDHDSILHDLLLPISDGTTESSDDDNNWDTFEFDDNSETEDVDTAAATTAPYAGMNLLLPAQIHSDSLQSRSTNGASGTDCCHQQQSSDEAAALQQRNTDAQWQLFKRAMRPVPCAVVFVYVNGRETSDCFTFHDRKINVIGYLGARTYETEGEEDDAVPFLQVRKAILKAAGDRTLERVITLAARLYQEQFIRVATRHRPQQDAFALFTQCLAVLPLVVTAPWNSYPTLKFFHDTAAMAWAEEELRVHECPPQLSLHDNKKGNNNKGECIVECRVHGALLSRLWPWACRLLRMYQQRGEWAQYVLEDASHGKDKLVAQWLLTDPRASSFLGGRTFTRKLSAHLGALHAEILRARQTPQEDTKLWVSEPIASHDGKIYRIFLSPICGPFITTIRPQQQQQQQQRGGGSELGMVERQPSSYNNTNASSISSVMMYDVEGGSHTPPHMAHTPGGGCGRPSPLMGHDIFYSCSEINSFSVTATNSPLTSTNTNVMSSTDNNAYAQSSQYLTVPPAMHTHHCPQPLSPPGGMGPYQACSNGSPDTMMYNNNNNNNNNPQQKMMGVQHHVAPLLVDSSGQYVWVLPATNHFLFAPQQQPPPPPPPPPPPSPYLSASSSPTFSYQQQQQQRVAVLADGRVVTLVDHHQ